MENQNKNQKNNNSSNSLGLWPMAAEKNQYLESLICNNFGGKSRSVELIDCFTILPFYRFYLFPIANFGLPLIFPSFA